MVAISDCHDWQACFESCSLMLCDDPFSLLNIKVSDPEYDRKMPSSLGATHPHHEGIDAPIIFSPPAKTGWKHANDDAPKKALQK